MYLSGGGWAFRTDPADVEAGTGWGSGIPDRKLRVHAK